MVQRGAVQIWDDDQARAGRDRVARQHLVDAGASAIPRQPWLHDKQPLSDVDLLRFTVWRGGQNQITSDDVEAGLTLVRAARAEIDQIETAILFLARAQGMSWGRIGRALGLGSAQAALQRSDRLSSRVASSAEKR